MNSKKEYNPNKRDYLEAKPKIVKAYSKKDYTKLPDNVRDPIVCNNIATSEFDYTSKDMYEDNPFE